MQRHFVTCPLCECMCGLQVDVEDEHVKLIRGDREDVWSKGYLCPKGTTLGHLHDDPDRLRQPMVRDGDRWREVSWDDAFARCEELIHGVLERHGIASATAFVGNPVGHSFTLGRYMPLFIGQSGMPHIYSSGTIDQWPKNVSCILMYGNMWKIPAPDIQRTDYLICMGGNPQASGGSLLACPDVLGELDGIRERGGKVVVIDPRRTGTADHADEWVPILPGTDAAFLLAMCNVLFAEGLTTLGRLEEKVKGVDTVREVCASFTPESVEAFCRVPADTIRRLAREFAAAPTGALYGRIGLCNQEFGTLASWLVDVVNILTGHFDTPGGSMFPRAAAWSVTVQPIPGLEDGAPEFGRYRTRVRGAKEVLGQVPVSCLAEEIATPGEGQIKALITVAGNPVLSTPAGHKLDEALPTLDAMIAVDLWLNETTRHADVILPGASPLEQPHHDDLILNFAINSIANYSAPVFARPDPDAPEEWEILIRLTGLCTGTPAEDVDVAAIDDGFFDYMAFTQGLDGAEIRKHYERGGPERILDLTLRTGPFGDRYGENPDGVTLEKLKGRPNGINFGPMVPQVPEILGTAD